MPGPPNRPPERNEEAPPVASVPDPPEKKALRRLVPTHVALLLDSWKGAPSPELTGPFARAEAAFAAGEFGAALSSLDLLSVRFTEPRWPTLPLPFRHLRVPIPAPTPPHWDPDHALSPPDREAKKARRGAEEQFGLAEASLAWAAAHGIATDDLSPALAAAKEALSAPGVSPRFFGHLDAVWAGLKPRLPRPGSGGTTPKPTGPAPAEA